MPDGPLPSVLPYDCSSHIVSNGSTEAIFKNLDVHEEYLPAVARASAKAFIAFAPYPVKLEPSQAQSGTFGNLNPMRDGNRPPPIQIDRAPLSAEGRTQASNSDTPLREGDNSKPFERPRLSGEQEDNMWKQWRAQHLPKIFSNLISTREINPVSFTPYLQPFPSNLILICKQGNGSYISSLHCPRLPFTFTAWEYFQVQLKSEDDANELLSKYIIFLHDFDLDEQAEGMDRYRLVISKYSFLKTSSLFSQSLGKLAAKAISDRELLLHFQAFSTMGQRPHAEIMRISDISHIKHVETYSTCSADIVEHIPQFPQGMSFFENLSFMSELIILLDTSMYSFFCRFAIQASPDSERSCLSLLGSNLLPHRNRWRQPSYKYPSSPKVFDMSPRIVWSSEGFSQASYDIHAAFDFNPSCDTTWKVRIRVLPIKPSCR